MISFLTRGSFKNLERFLKSMRKREIYNQLNEYAREGVRALAENTPVDSGITASSWTYEIEDSRKTYTIKWLNKNVNKGVNIAIILQYGHGTGTGGYVAGRDYINPAIQPVFNRISDKVWKAVTSA